MTQPDPITIVVLGESAVGKTCFADRFGLDTKFARYDAWEMGGETPYRVLGYNGAFVFIETQDISTTPWRQRTPEFSEELFCRWVREAEGFVLLYDITDGESFEHVINFGYDMILQNRKSEAWNGVTYPSYRQRFGGVLVGNKLDLVEKGERKRAVSKAFADEWATMHGMKHFEVDTSSQAVLDDLVRALLKRMDRAKEYDNESIVRVQYETWKEQNPKEYAEEKEKKQKNGPSKFFSKLRTALPSTPQTKKKFRLEQNRPPTPPTRPPWKLFFDRPHNSLDQDSASNKK